MTLKERGIITENELSLKSKPPDWPADHLLLTCAGRPHLPRPALERSALWLFNLCFPGHSGDVLVKADGTRIELLLFQSVGPRIWIEVELA